MGDRCLLAKTKLVGLTSAWSKWLPTPCKSSFTFSNTPLRSCPPATHAGSVAHPIFGPWQDSLHMLHSLPVWSPLKERPGGNTENGQRAASLTVQQPQLTLGAMVQLIQTLRGSSQSITFTRICNKPGSWRGSQGSGLIDYNQKKYTCRGKSLNFVVVTGLKSSTRTEAFGDIVSKQDTARSPPARQTQQCCRL